MLIFNKYCGRSNKQEDFFEIFWPFQDKARVIQVKLSIGLLHFLDSKMHM